MRVISGNPISTLDNRSLRQQMTSTHDNLGLMVHSMCGRGPPLQREKTLSEEALCCHGRQRGRSVCLGARPAGHVRASRSSAAPPGAAHPPSVAPADAQALAPGAAPRRRRAWCPTAQEPSTISHYHGCHRRRLRSSSPRPRSDLVPRLSSLQRRGPRQGVQRRRAGGRGAASYRAVAPAHRTGPLHPEAACGSLPVSPCDPLG